MGNEESYPDSVKLSATGFIELGKGVDWSSLAPFTREPMTKHERDNDETKGAVEPEDPKQRGQSSMRGQLGHRTKNKMIKDSDSDFPEPGGNPEHSGEPEAPEED